MDGTAELRQLAHLLRVGAGAASDIASLRPVDAEAIEALAEQALAIAADFERIADRGGSAVAATASPR